MATKVGMYSATHESVTVARGQCQENTDRVKNQSDCRTRYHALFFHSYTMLFIAFHHMSISRHVHHFFNRSFFFKKGQCDYVFSRSRMVIKVTPGKRLSLHFVLLDGRWTICTKSVQTLGSSSATFRKRNFQLNVENNLGLLINSRL